MSLTSQQYAALANDVYHEPRETGEDSSQIDIGGVAYRRLDYVDRPSGYQGIIYGRVDTGEIVVAHRGTEFDRQPVHDGVYADGGMVTSRSNAQINDAIQLTRRALDLAERQASRDGHAPEVTVTGHSLGGNLAQVTAHHFGLNGQTFNAYGAVSLDRRIAEGGNGVINHVMGGDAVSAASRHYGQVRIYSTAHEVATLEGAGYANEHSGPGKRNPLAVAIGLGESHRMHNFLPVDGAGRPDLSVLEDPRTRQLAQQYAPMIDEYRADVETLRVGATLWSRGVYGLARDGLDHLRGPLEPGAGRRAMAAPSWHEHVRQLHREREHSAAPAGWQVPLKLGAQEERAATPAQIPRQASLQEEAGAFLDRMLAAARSGDHTQFRLLTQELAHAEPGRALRAEAVETVDRQERQAALQVQLQQAELQQQEPLRSGARSL